MNNFYTFLISSLNRSFNGYRESLGENRLGWHLTGSTLAHFIHHYSLEGLKEIHIAANGALRIWVDSMVRHDCKVLSECKAVYNGVTIIIHSLKYCPDVVLEYPKDYDRQKLQFPVKIGTDLDDYDYSWSESKDRQAFDYPENIFFTSERRKNGVDFIGKMLECGEKAGIKDRMFLGFGNCLGYALIQGFLPNDDDIDMCIDAEGMPQGQRHQYLMECKSAGLCENRMHGPITIKDEYAWFSIGPKSPFTENGVKSCNWFWFKHGGYWWHSKGKEWIGRRDLSDKYVTAKGIPETLFTGKLKKVMFHGVEVQIPDPLGCCLDWWYPGFVSRKKDASAIKVLLNIPDEKDKKTWFITKK